MSAPYSEQKVPASWVVALVSFIVLLGLFGLASRPYVNRGMAMAAETKQNLHAIQLALERYAVDNGGQYPLYLIGGAAKYSVAVPYGLRRETKVFDCPDSTGVSDTLLREGYLMSYPRNPFTRDGRAVRRLQEDLPSSITGNDPLRNGDADATLLGTRFGPDCILMGQVLCDPRFEEWACYAGGQDKPEYRDTWAIVEYDFFDQWTGAKKPKPYLPGQFFYKSVPYAVSNEYSAQDLTSKRYFPGPSIRPPFNRHLSLAGEQLGPIIYRWNTNRQFKTGNVSYLLGAYGGLRVKGQDVLGEERFVDYQGKDDARAGQNPAWPLWTRSQYNLNEMAGSPYYLKELDSQGRIVIKNDNSNGVQDGIIALLFN